MGLLTPTVALSKVTEITPSLLTKMGIDAILLDVDNTLAPPTETTPYDGVQEWIGYIGITRIEGSYFNVVGFPVHLVYSLLQEFLED